MENLIQPNSPKTEAFSVDYNSSILLSEEELDSVLHDTGNWIGLSEVFLSCSKTAPKERLRKKQKKREASERYWRYY